MSREWGAAGEKITGTLPSAIAPPWTMAAWIRPDSPGSGTSFARIVSLGNDQYIRLRTGMVLQTWQGGTSGSAAISSTAVATGSWSVVFGRVRSDLQGRLFIGTQAAKVVEVAYSSQSTGSGLVTSTALALGNSDGGTFTFDGRIGHAAIWNRELSIEEMEAFRLGLVPLDGLRHYWPLDSPTASVATDLLGGVASTVTGCTLAEDPPAIMGFERAIVPSLVVVSTVQPLQLWNGSSWVPLTVTIDGSAVAVSVA